MELVVKDTIEIPEGRKTGRVVKIVERTTPFHYLDLVIAIDGLKKSDGSLVELTYGCALSGNAFSPKAKLGRLLSLFGTDPKPGGKFDDVTLNKIFVGKNVQFLTQNEETEKGVFARIVDGTLKPNR